MPLLNRFWPYSDSWHVAVNSNVKHTNGQGIHDVAMIYMGVHDVGVHDVGARVHSMGVHSVGVYGVGVHGMDVPGVGVH
jgi:hypothetical protein